MFDAVFGRHSDISLFFAFKHGSGSDGAQFALLSDAIKK
jgi:hypothetical protein